METDLVVPIGKSLIQHGYFNNRIYLIQIHPDDVETIIKRINYLQLVFAYGKIILKIPRSFLGDFLTPDSRVEATIPGYYQGREDALFISRFYDHNRADEDAYNIIQKNLTSCQNQHLPSIHKKSSDDFLIRKAEITDIPDMCSLYRNVFETYPFPIHEPYYLKKVMGCGVPFFIAKSSDTIIAAGSCEMDNHASAVEMSDIAVDPKFRGRGLSKRILSHMEAHMKENLIKTAYTICRAGPLQINRLFSGFGYQFGGTLIKNTNICGKFESMNIWYKPLN